MSERPPYRNGSAPSSSSDLYKKQKLQQRLELTDAKRRAQVDQRGGYIASNSQPKPPGSARPPLPRAPAPPLKPSDRPRRPDGPAGPRSSSPRKVSAPAVQILSPASSSATRISVSSKAPPVVVEADVPRPVKDVETAPAKMDIDTDVIAPKVIAIQSMAESESDDDEDEPEVVSPAKTRGIDLKPLQTSKEAAQPVSQLSSPSDFDSSPGSAMSPLSAKSSDDNEKVHPDPSREERVVPKLPPSSLAPMFDPSTTPLSTTPPQINSNIMNQAASVADVSSALGGLTLNQYVNRPCPVGTVLKCRIERCKDSMGKQLYPHYEVYLEATDNHPKTFLMSARKRKKSKSSNYQIATVKLSTRIKEEIVGKVRSNFLGTTFVLYDNGYNPFKDNKIPGKGRQIRRELGAVVYDPNILGFKGPRKMHVIVPRMQKNLEPIVVAPKVESETLTERHRRLALSDILVLQNKQPQWNEDSQSYVLNFSGRVTMASVKNFQVVHQGDLDYVILQFGRIHEDAFTLDFQYPMTPLQAFSIALTSFDAKLACE